MQRYRFVGTVLESQLHGPQLCAFLRTSLPPQGGGPDVVGWEWSNVAARSVGGTTWGDYEVVGTFDGERFTLTEPARPAQRRQKIESSGPDFRIPCPPPPGGWRPVDPVRTTRQALDAAFERVMDVPEYAGAWVRDLRNNGVGEDHDPFDLVLITKFAGNLGGRVKWIREVWGGALCVSPAPHSLAELTAIQDQLHQTLGGVSQTSEVNIPANRVEFDGFLITDELQQRVNEAYGQGTVALTSWLEPIDG